MSYLERISNQRTSQGYLIANDASLIKTCADAIMKIFQDQLSHLSKEAPTTLRFCISYTPYIYLNHPVFSPFTEALDKELGSAESNKSHPIQKAFLKNVAKELAKTECSFNIEISEDTFTNIFTNFVFLSLHYSPTAKKALPKVDEKHPLDITPNRFDTVDNYKKLLIVCNGVYKYVD